MERQSELIRFLADTRLYLSGVHGDGNNAGDEFFADVSPAEAYLEPVRTREWDPFEVWRRHIKQGA